MITSNPTLIKLSFLYEILVGFVSYFCEVLQPLRWCCVDCLIHHEQDVREE